ncbi:hypothetical protein CCHR01_06516 [Colletotrichum chrysophilum]|uniref:Uncharacterized protein n=1 Tax=Colletotrichum chrysophilum TaxID=1836956 RepID=A0AAD9EGR2_9PEZI|nr:hypothetical protein CCHR01_06516 [Colletotrichum chrysophilum]
MPVARSVKSVPPTATKDPLGFREESRARAVRRRVSRQILSTNTKNCEF